MESGTFIPFQPFITFRFAQVHFIDKALDVSDIGIGRIESDVVAVMLYHVLALVARNTAVVHHAPVGRTHVQPGFHIFSGNRCGFEDIIFEPEEIPIIRGGWYDRNGVFFSNSMDTNSLKSINIIKKGVVDSKNRNNF